MNTKTKLLLLSWMPLFVRRRLMLSRYKREIDYTGEAELLELRRFVNWGELALDVGSNLGTYAYELGRLSGRTIAFEPNPALARFVRSLRLYGVEIRETALSSRDETADLLVPQMDKAHGAASLRKDAAVAMGGAVAHVPVQTQRLDSIALDPVHFIKIDVEGFEEEVLDGARETIKRDKPTLLIEIEERFNAGGVSRVAASLAQHGYTGHFFLRSDWRPIAEFDIDLHQRAFVTALRSFEGHMRREVQYINNFLFLPAGKSVPAAL
jgi:FkbM family methyltransferase